MVNSASRGPTIGLLPKIASFATLPTYCSWGVDAAVPYRGCILIPLQAVVGRSTIKLPRLWEVSLQKDENCCAMTFGGNYSGLYSTFSPSFIALVHKN